MINKQLIKDWLTNIPNDEYEQFIQLYFILNNYFCEIFPSSNNQCKDGDEKRMTEKLPQIINEQYEIIAPNIDRLRLLLLHTFKYIIKKDLYLSKEKNDIFFTELIKIRYSGKTYIITSEDKKIFETINNYIESNAKIIVQSALRIIYAVRNNFYHGSKKRLPEQVGLLSYLNQIIVAIIQITCSLKTELYDEEINDNLDRIMSHYDNVNEIHIQISFSENNTDINIDNYIENIFMNYFVENSEYEIIIQLVNQHWESKNEFIKDEVKNIRFLLIKYIDKYIEKSARLRKNTYNVGYLEISRFAFVNHNLTQIEIALFKKILSLKKFDLDNTTKILKLIFTLLTEFEINIQVDLQKYYFLIVDAKNKLKRIISILQETNTDYNINTHNNQEENLQNILKEEFTELFRNEENDFKNWVQLVSNPYYQFAYNFIVLEKINSIIKRVIYSENTHNIIYRIKNIKCLLGIEFEDRNGKRIDHYETLFKEISTERKNIFHGNRETSLNDEQISILNQKLVEFIKQIIIWFNQKVLNSQLRIP